MTTTQQHPTGLGAPDVEATDRAAGHPWLIVAAREIIVRATNRTFLVSTLITLVFIGGFAAFSAWQAGKTTTYTVAVSAAEGTQLVQQAAATARSTDGKVVLTPTTVPGEEAARAAVDRGEV